MSLPLTRVDELVGRLTRPTYVLRFARANDRRSDSLGRSARTRAANAEREIVEVVNEITGATATETALWDRVEAAEVHARRFNAQAGRAAGIGEDLRARVTRESGRIYETKTDAFLEAIALLRVGGSTSQVALAHAKEDVWVEFRRRCPREDR